MANLHEEQRASLASVDLTACPLQNSHHGCRCGACAKCGFQKHTGVHGPEFGKQGGVDPPIGHEFVPRPVEAEQGADS